MFYSLRFGILMAMLAIAAVTITTVTIFVGMTTRAQFVRYIEAGREIREERLQQAVVMWVDSDSTQSFNAADFMLFLTDGSNDAENVVQMTATNSALNTANSSPRSDIGSIRFAIAPDGGATVYRGTEVLGTLYVDPISELELLPAQKDFMQTLNWTLVVTAIVAGMAAIALTIILSRRILHPVAALTIATRRMEHGDLTQRVIVHAGGEIGELAHAFNSLSQTLSRNEELRRNMVSDIAHELRTPVTNIRGYLEAIQDQVLHPDENTINLLHEEAISINRLIQDLQELALAEAGALYYETQPVALDDVVEQTVHMLQPSAHSRSIHVIAQLPLDIPPVRADQRRVTQVLRNLISNAIRHTPPDGEIRVTAEVYSEEIEVSVTDTGEGIDSENLPYIFERFWRADPSRSRATGGAGLGLAIVKQIVEAQGGRVQVESVQGKGSTFSFTLPRYSFTN